MKRFKVTLTADERQSLHALIAAGKGAARKLTHARILLKADASDDGLHWPDWRIADALEVQVSMPSSGSADASSSRDSTPPWNARSGTPRHARPSWTAGPRPA